MKLILSFATTFNSMFSMHIIVTVQAQHKLQEKELDLKQQGF